MRVATTSLGERVAEAIREGIRTRELEPGRLYQVHELADQLDVSRTPVREALMRLTEAGMVQVERNRGFRILKPTVWDLEEIFQLRLMLEPPAAHRAGQHIDDALVERLREELDAMGDAATAHDPDRLNRFMEHDVRFHELVLAASGNGRLVRQVRNLRDITRTLGASALLEYATGGNDSKGSPTGTLSDVVKQHEPILDALATGDPMAAGAAMYRHIEQTGDLLIQQQIAEDPQQHKAFEPPWNKALASSLTEP